MSNVRVLLVTFMFVCLFVFCSYDPTMFYLHVNNRPWGGHQNEINHN